MTFTIKDFLDKFFDLFRENQAKTSTKEIAEVLRDFTNKVDELC